MKGLSNAPPTWQLPIACACTTARRSLALAFCCSIALIQDLHAGACSAASDKGGKTTAASIAVVLPPHSCMLAYITASTAHLLLWPSSMLLAGRVLLLSCTHLERCMAGMQHRHPMRVVACKTRMQMINPRPMRCEMACNEHRRAQSCSSGLGRVQSYAFYAWREIMASLCFRSGFKASPVLVAISNLGTSDRPSTLLIVTSGLHHEVLLN